MAKSNGCFLWYFSRKIEKDITCLVRISASYNELTLNDVQSKAEVVIIRL